MKSTLESLEGLTRLIKIEVPATKVNETFTKIYTGIQRSANIKGFRKGKAPLSAVKSLYRERVMQDALQQLVSDSYPKAVDEHSLDPISQPQIEVISFDDDKDLAFNVQVEVRPEVKLQKIEGLPVEKEKLVVDKTKVDEVLENIRKNFQEIVPVLEDRVAQSGDVVKIDFDGFIDNQPLDGGQAKDHQLELGSNSFIPGFEEQIVGMKSGSEKSINLKFPDDYHAKDLMGKPVEFKVKLNSINKIDLPELNDELAQKVNEKFKTMQDLEGAILDDLETSEKKRIDEDLKNRLVKTLAKENPVDVPVSLKENQKGRLLQDVEQRLSSQGVDKTGIAEYQKKWSADLDETAAFMVQSSFLIDAIAEKFDLKPIDNEVEGRIAKMAKDMNADLKMVQEYYSTPERKSGIRFQVMEDKVIDFLLEKANVVEVSKDKLTESV